jgi:hypothetical protein
VNLAVRSVDLALHRLHVGHGIPARAAPVARWLERVTRSGFERREQQRILEEAHAVRAAYEGRTLTLRVTRAPRGLGASDVVAVAGAPVVEGVTCLADALSPQQLLALTEHVRGEGGRRLRGLSVAAILRVLDRASRLWLDPAYAPRSLAIEAIHRRTGFSREMVIHSIDLEMRSSRKLDMWRTLWTELGNPRVLDARSWAPAGEAPVRAYGPRLVAAVFSSNIPALPHLSYMRALAVKAPLVGKVATNEPIFASLYIDTLLELCPDLEPALAAVWFPGSDREATSALLTNADYVIAYGGDAALAEIAERIPRDARRTLHGHRMGVGVVDATSLARGASELARSIAYDFAVFDGQACLAPAVYFVEGDARASIDLANDVGIALEAVDPWLPPRTMTVAERAARRSTVESWDAMASFGDGSSTVVRSRGTLRWAGLVTSGPFAPQRLGDRLFHVHRIPDVGEVPRILAPYRQYLQNVALAVRPAEQPGLATALAELGASRSTRPGRMPTPSMMWHHDGHACIADLIRWADLG